MAVTQTSERKMNDNVVWTVHSQIRGTNISQTLCCHLQPDSEHSNLPAGDPMEDWGVWVFCCFQTITCQEVAYSSWKGTSSIITIADLLCVRHCSKRGIDVNETRTLPSGSLLSSGCLHINN